MSISAWHEWMRVSAEASNSGPTLPGSHSTVTEQGGLMIESAEVANQANQLILQGNVEGALALFREHLKNDPFEPKVVELVDSLLMAPDQGRGLVDFYRDLQKTYPDDWRLVVSLARAYSKTGKDSLAVVQLQKLLRNESQHAEVWMELAICYKRLDKLELALRALNSLIDIHASYGPAHVARIRYLVEADDLPEAAAASVFSLEVSDLSAPVRDWVDKVNLALEQGLRPEDDLLYRNVA
jgi:predicted Zn-dependent protease